MKSIDLSFKRKETKYIILEHTYEEIIKEIEEHIPIFRFDDRPGILSIETTYLDSKDFVLFKEYLNKRKSRFKIRLRRYAYNGMFDPVYLVEIKLQHNSVSTKKRFILPENYLNDFLNGNDLLPIIKVANNGIIGAQKTYKIIQNLRQINQLIPVLQTSYNRVAFQKKSKRIRMTIDNNITHKKLLGSTKTETLDAFVLESKII